MSPAAAKARRVRTRATRERSPFEIATLSVAVLAIAAVLVALFVSEVRVASGPADLRVQVTPAGTPHSGGAPYDVVVRNVGGETAENVEIEVTLGTETRTLTLPAVTRSDEERGTVVFPAGSSGAPEATIQSYTEVAR